MEFLDGFLVISEVLLASNENDGKAVAKMENLRDPLYDGVSRESIIWPSVC